MSSTVTHRLEQELSSARRVAAEAMRMLSDDQLAELRRRLDEGENDAGDRNSEGAGSHP
jgi:C4-dicarboxylate-specific signal transduction histidine kinase